jgi:hypothetical protein
MRCRLLALALPLVLFGCQSNFASRFLSKSPSYNDEAYQVYSGLFAEKDTVGISPGHLVIIQQETTPGFGTFRKDVAKCFPSDWRFRWEYESALSDYYVENHVPRALSRRFSIAGPYELVPKRRIDALVASAKFLWQGFTERYPHSNGYIVVSAVGFNRNKTRAVVYAEVDCGVLCGLGRYYTMEKLQGKWVEAHVGCTWMS